MTDETAEPVNKPEQIINNFVSPSSEAITANTQIKLCPACLKENKLTAKFCKYCGESFESIRFCEQCGSKLTPGKKICYNCGARIE